MRENRTCGSEGGEAQSLPYPYPSALPPALTERHFYTAGETKRGLRDTELAANSMFLVSRCFWGDAHAGASCRPGGRRSCAHDGVLSARWKSVRGFYLDPEIEANCVVARRGGEQAKMNYRTAG